MFIPPYFCYHNQALTNKPKVIVFDIGGVLLNWKAVVREISNLLKITEDSFYENLYNNFIDLDLGKKHQDEFWNFLTQKFNPNIEPTLLKKIWIEKQQKIDFAWLLLKDIRKMGYRAVCCTNNWKETIEKQLELHPDFSLFEFILNSADVGIRKPNEEIYKIVEEKVGESGKDMFLIDDLKSNCEGAEKIGWQTFIFDSETDNGSKDAEIIAEMLEIN